MFLRRMGLAAMRISNPARRNWMLLPSTLAIALLSLLGGVGESLGYDRWLRANTVKHRTHSPTGSNTACVPSWIGLVKFSSPSSESSKRSFWRR